MVVEFTVMDVKILDRVCSVKPTTAALKRMIATQVPEQDQPNALLLLKRFKMPACIKWTLTRQRELW